MKAVRPGITSLTPLPRFSKGKVREGHVTKDEPVVLNREVKWRATSTGDIIGTCARCKSATPAVELRWRNDRSLFGNDVQGSWECRHCFPKAGKFDVKVGGFASRHFARETGANRVPTPSEVEGMLINARIERGRTFMGYSGPHWWVEGLD